MSIICLNFFILVLVCFEKSLPIFVCLNAQISESLGFLEKSKHLINIRLFEAEQKQITEISAQLQAKVSLIIKISTNNLSIYLNKHPPFSPYHYTKHPQLYTVLQKNYYNKFQRNLTSKLVTMTSTTRETVFGK